MGRSLRSHHRAQEVSCPLIIRPEAEADLVEGFDWYEQRRSGLGDEFLNEVQTRLRSIEENPLRHAAVYRKSEPKFKYYSCAGRKSDKAQVGP